jgi:hypothetical protein
MNNNVTVSWFRDMASQLAIFWVKHIRPMPFESSFHINGIEVEIRVREAKSDTKPLRAIDEDDLRVD